MPCLPRARGLASLLALTAVLLAGCEDPSGVGLTVLDPGNTDPNARVFAAQTATTRLPSFTGREGARMLAGRAEDPLFGTVEASGYMDFGQAAGPGGDFFGTPIERIVLRLRPDYRYGEAQGVAIYDLYEVFEGWNAPALPSDSALAVRPELVASIAVAPGDTLVDVDLPAAWVAARDSLFRSANFNQAFHGFEFRPRPESRAVLGFDAARSSLLLIADRGETPDTVTYAATQVFSNVRRTGAPQAGLLPVHAGVSEGLGLTFALDSNGSPPAVTGAFVRLEADTTLLGGGGFVRPLARTLALYGLNDGQSPVQISTATLDTRTQAYVFATPTSPTRLSSIFQQALLGRPLYARYAVGVVGPTSLDLAPLVTSEGAPPRLILLVISSE